MGLDAAGFFGRLEERKREKMLDFTSEELHMIHLGLIARQRLLKDMLRCETDSVEIEKLETEYCSIDKLCHKVCYAKLQKDLKIGMKKYLTA